MGEELKISAYEPDVDGGSDGEEERVLEWEVGLPNSENLTPLSQVLISPELASAFRISPEPRRTVQDVNRASRTTLSNLRGGQSQALSSNNFKSFDDDRTDDIDPMVVEWEDGGDQDGAASDSRKLAKFDCAEDANSALQTDSTDDPSARNSKRPRLVWTPQLHKRFVDVVAHLGIKSAVPKTIMQLMNVEGLTRENVASHLQKYRLYLKRMQGFSNDGPSSSDQLLASTPLPNSLKEVNSVANSLGNGHIPMPIPIPYMPPPMMPMPVFGMRPANGYQGFESYPYNLIQQRDWYGNKYGSASSYPHAAPSADDK